MKSIIKSKIKGSHLLSKIYWRYIYCPAVLQMNLSDIALVSDEFNGYHVNELSLDSSTFDEYLEFINVSYEEKIYTRDGLKYYLLNHKWLKDVKTYILINDNGRIVASISAGVYQKDEKWGGIFKFATDKNLRKQGLGLYMLRYGYNTLLKRGCLYGESIVSLRNTRIPSLMTHFKCGFKPQTKRNKVIYSVVSRNGGLKHWFTRRWVLKYYRLFLEKHKLNNQ